MFTGYELAVNARIRGGLTMFGGVALQKTVLVTCDQPDDPNLLRFCDQRNSDIPFGADYKLNVSYPLPFWGLSASAVFQSYRGQPAETNWLITRTTRYAADCAGPCTPNGLVIPGLTEASARGAAAIAGDQVPRTDEPGRSPHRQAVRRPAAARSAPRWMSSTC